MIDDFEERLTSPQPGASFNDAHGSTLYRVARLLIGLIAYAVTLGTVAYVIGHLAS